MKILRIEIWRESVPLTRPYVIASHRTDAVELFFARVVGESCVGVGSGSPSEVVTGESLDACWSALRKPELQRLCGIRHCSEV